MLGPLFFLLSLFLSFSFATAVPTFIPRSSDTVTTASLVQSSASSLSTSLSVSSDYPATDTPSLTTKTLEARVANGPLDCLRSLTHHLPCIGRAAFDWNPLHLLSCKIDKSERSLMCGCMGTVTSGFDWVMVNLCGRAEEEEIDENLTIGENIDNMNARESHDELSGGYDTFPPPPEPTYPSRRPQLVYPGDYEEVQHVFPPNSHFIFHPHRPGGFWPYQNRDPARRPPPNYTPSRVPIYTPYRDPVRQGRYPENERPIQVGSAATVPPPYELREDGFERFG